MVSVERVDCRLCGGRLHKVFELRPSPVANSYPEKPDKDAKRYPMELMACDDCGHVQQRYVLDHLFEDYKYRTPLVEDTQHKELARRIADEYPNGLVLEIGCNNGVFIDCMRAEGLIAFGIDPAASHPNAVRACFTEEVAESYAMVDAVVGLNVFAHIDDLRDVFRGIAKILKPDGVLIFEAQYLVDLINSGEFDMIYHEHLDYHTVRPLVPFLRSFGLVMTQWEHIKNHGGSIRITARKYGEQCELPDEVLDWGWLKSRIDMARERMQALPGKYPAFGAAAKATTLISELGLEDKISYVVDDTPQKQFRYIPGTDIPIYPVSRLRDEDVILTAWNYADVIAKRIPNKLIHPFEARDYRA